MRLWGAKSELLLSFWSKKRNTDGRKKIGWYILAEAGPKIKVAKRKLTARITANQFS